MNHAGYGLRLLTVGHSNHPCETFLDLLAGHQVTAVADVRSQPYSQYVPQFNREALENVLARQKIKYVFMGKALGARREERECYVGGKARYELIVKLQRFQEGLEQLRHEAKRRRIALLCSEKDPLTCHRTILICRHLRGHGFDIQRILEDGSLESQERAEGRLLRLIGLPEWDLFHDRTALVERAYDMQAEAIAFAEARDGAGDSALNKSRASMNPVD